MRSRNSRKELWVRILSVMLIASVGSAFAACKKKTRVPAKEEYLKASLENPDRAASIKDYDFDRKSLKSAWGAPTIDGGEFGNDVWSCGEKFLVADYSSDDPNKIEALYASYTQELVVLFNYVTIVYASVRSDGVTNYQSCLTLAEQWFTPEDLEKLQPGTILQIEFNGMFMESFPEQIYKPYSIKITGQVDESEMTALEEQANYIRDHYTGEQ
ncbi:MAG: hypothetical protein J6040_09920 [Clostridiales bacterium]|nr:hypothetical protein [Clostridiales bacterium]